MTKTLQCQRCGTSFSQEIPDDEGPFSAMRSMLLTRRFCGNCGVIIDEEGRMAQEAEKARYREERWNVVCPPIYRNTDVTHDGLSPVFREAAMAWEPFSDRGLGFMGASGAGKTRLLFLALRKAFDADLSIRYITHNSFSKLVIEAFSSGHSESKNESMRILENLSKVKVLLFDDLGKAPSTERCDAELEELIEVRGANMRPTLWSCNGYGEWLVKRFGADRGEPLVRRLAEFSTVVRA